MKKISAIILAAIMLVMMALPAFAGEAYADGYVANPEFGVKKANTAWKADGVYSEGEYYDIAVQKTWISGAWADDADKDACLNLNFKLAMSWDENYVYTYVNFVDPDGAHSNTTDGDPGSMWQQGAIQMNLAEADSTGDQRLEYGVTKSSDTGALLTTVWADYLGSGYDALANSDFTVNVDGANITYEVRTPFTAFSGVKPVEGAKYGFCLVIAWGQEATHKHTQLSSGCTGFGKDAGAFAKINLEAAPEIVTEAPETEAPAAETEAPVVTPAAQTADIFAVAAVVAVIALGGVVVCKKH